MVDDLHRLLRAASIPCPYVLVGHSFGGLLMRLYAYQHIYDVVGLVFVDSMHESQFDVLGPMFPPPTPSDAPVLRQMRAFWTGGWRDPQSTPECIDFLSSFRQASDAVSLGNVLVHVITTGTFLHAPMASAAHRVELQRGWEGLQRQFLTLSSRAAQSIAVTSGHFAQRHDPKLVIDIIKTIVVQGRREAGAKTAAQIDKLARPTTTTNERTTEQIVRPRVP